MAKKESSVVKSGRKDSEEAIPRSAAHFERGIHTDVEFAAASIAVAWDLVTKAITASVGNSIKGNLSNVLKVIELKHKYGKQARSDGDKTLRISAA